MAQLSASNLPFLPPMTSTMAYPAYDSYSRPRRPSMGYPGTPAASFQRVNSYHDPMMTYPQPNYSIYSAPSASLSQHHIPAYDDMGIGRHDSYYQGDHYLSNGVYPPVVQPMSLPRRRRSSSVSYSSRPAFSGNFLGGPSIVKFKRKGAFRSGVTLSEAQANVRLSGYDSYTYHDLNVDARGKIYLRIRWPGYSPLNYEIPIDGYDGRVDLQALARRVGRAVAHYLQANVVPIPWDRIELQQLEEVEMGTWSLKMTTH
ncbi:hypothetical protein BV22DRAFT_1053341 [Leucogyrophana mollusca]|uniref:Uncharacterized protein n=1 Tax=Leucogyrophana mollusca TaxID=85980 RepID=A0ACB8C0N9_9AGAM|nr:hypothetical protein BV22DRAFT_1053341 [Leucogyrophana mollusca]